MEPNNNTDKINARLDALLKDNELVQNNRNEIWRKHDQAIILLSSAVLIILSQFSTIPQWVFLTIPIALLGWWMFFVLVFWDAVAVSKYHDEIRQEIDYEIGKPTLHLREEIENKYWNPHITKVELGEVNPRYISQVVSFLIMTLFYFFFSTVGILWLWNNHYNVWLVITSIIFYALMIPIFIIWIYTKFRIFVNKHIFSKNHFDSLRNTNA